MKINIGKCARCEQDHRDIEIDYLLRPIMDGDKCIANAWAMCPTVNQPIIILVNEQNDKPFKFGK